MPTDPTTSALISGPGSWCKIGPITRTAGNGEAVVPMQSAVKNRLLGDSTSLSSSVRQRAEGILRRIHNKQVAALLGFKETAASKAPFRLVKRIAADSKPEIRDSSDSFIALSYCWHEKDWLPAGSGGSATGGAVPISPVLFEALLEERLSDDEGVWIDQMCIIQSDEVEKAMAIGSMDVIYRRARLVVVALEDIVIDGSDVAALHELMRALNSGHKWLCMDYLAPSRQLTKLLWKIFSARWFTRAWCGHELLVSSNQLFLIQSDMADASIAVVKMTSEFLYDLSVLAKSVTSYLAVHDFAQLETTYGRQLSRFYTYATPKFTARWSDKRQEDRAFTQSYMRVFSQIFGFNASVVTDKLSIVLNVLQCGLFYSGPAMTPDRCCYVFYHIALCRRRPHESLGLRQATRAGSLDALAAWRRHHRALQHPSGAYVSRAHAPI